MRDHAPDPAAWMVDVAGIAGDDMDVAVHYDMAGDVTDVCADVVAVNKKRLCHNKPIRKDKNIL